MGSIRIENAQEGNLKNISLEIPKNKLVVFTGLSGSGKSTLLIDVLFNECQRQYLEALSMEGIHKPKVDRIRGASPAIVIAQTDGNKNPRSTVGTVSDIYTDLRMVYEKLGTRTCPYCKETICASECKEETEKRDNDFYVSMYCSKCGKKMDKITRTHFSFNTREGACPTCEGLGKIHKVPLERAVNESISLEDGGICCFEKQYSEYQITILYQAYKYYGIPIPAGSPVGEFSRLQKEILYHGIDCQLVKETFPDKKPPKTVSMGKFEGVIPILWRRLAGKAERNSLSNFEPKSAKAEAGDKIGDSGKLEQYFDVLECPDCRGERIGQPGRSVTVMGVRLPMLSVFSLEKLYMWVAGLKASLDSQQEILVEAYLRDMETKLMRYRNVGLGYLSLDRQTITLSGGELQRLRLAAVLDSDLSGVIYILDEPTAGLHPRDTAGLIQILYKLRDLENTVLVIEHDMDVMAAADYIIDIGPGSGRFGGEVVGQGTIDEIKKQERSVTGNCLRNPRPPRKAFRKASGQPIQIVNADKFNLKNIDISIPAGCLTAVTGPSGSGKSTLIFEVLARGNAFSENNKVSGLEQFDKVVEIEQSPITKMKRSNVATYSDVYSEIRNLFAKTPEAGEAGLTSRHFSFNSPGGRCENCQGLGYVDSNMLFFTNIEVICPVCNGKQFNHDVLAVKVQGLTIKDVLKLSVEEAASLFGEHPKILGTLNLLLEVGLGYLELGQTLTTLSGGEGQRLKLAKELIGCGSHKHNLYLMDEPTTGLHPKDVEHFLALLNRMADAGNTVIVVEHNQQLIENCDWIIELGPEGGEKGGRILYSGMQL